MEITTIILIILAAIIVWVIMTYNRFIKLVNLVKESWSGIDVQLKRRFNLIPNLIETVKGYAKHEAETLEELTKMRTGTDDVHERGAEEGRISKAIQDLLVAVENYPDLKASTNFLELQRDLNEIETEIQMARRYYNGTVRDLNIQVESFPSNLIANIFNFNSAEFFEIGFAEQREVPKVEF